MVGVGGLDSTSDRNGTGERGSVENDPDLETESDIAADGIVRPRKSASAAGSIRRKRRNSASRTKRSRPQLGSDWDSIPAEVVSASYAYIAADARSGRIIQRSLCS